MEEKDGGNSHPVLIPTPRRCRRWFQCFQRYNQLDNRGYRKQQNVRIALTLTRHRNRWPFITIFILSNDEGRHIAYPQKALHKLKKKKNIYAHSTQVLPRSKIPLLSHKCKMCQLTLFWINTCWYCGRVQVRRRPTPPHPNLSLFLSCCWLGLA